jgi:hypothetical protein
LIAVDTLTIVVFPVDRALRSRESRRVRSGRLSSDGHFSFKDLPAGDYLMTAVSTVRADEWRDPAFLDALSQVAVPVQVPEAGTITQRLRVAR